MELVRSETMTDHSCATTMATTTSNVSQSSPETSKVITPTCCRSFFDFNLVEPLLSQLEQLAQQSTTTEPSKRINDELVYQKFSVCLDNFQEQPHLIDAHLTKLIDRLLNIIQSAEQKNSLAFHVAFKFLYHITKLRGFKTIARYMPHEAVHVEFVISLVRSQSIEQVHNWQTRYMLLLWLSVLVLIPFHLKRFDDHQEVVQDSLMQRIYNLILEFLLLQEKSSDAAAFLAARFFSRPEVAQLYLQPFLEWVQDSNLCQNAVLLALAYLFKMGKREELRSHAENLLTELLKLDILADQHRLYVKNMVKLIQRLGLCFLKVRIAKWRYQRGRRNLLDNLKYSGQSGQESLQGDLQTSIQNEFKTGDDDIENEEEEEDDEETMEKVGEIVNLLLLALKHKNTQVRWSAAKGCGRISERLSAEQADQIVQGLLQLLQPLEQESGWHGGCLALAELSRRGLLLPVNLPQAMKALTNALNYDQTRGGFSVGASVRDAACYLSWAFARAFDRDILSPYADQLATNLTVVALFDREVNVRRAASAAFQENAGRHGTLPNGIQVLTIIDHMAVSLPSRSFLELSVQVAQFETYRRPMLEHLIQYKITHWDFAIRELAARTVGNLCSVLDVQLLLDQLPTLLKMANSNNPFEIHGGMLTLAELLQGLAGRKRLQTVDEWPAGKDHLIEDEHFTIIREILVERGEKLLHLSCHAELVSQGVCELIKQIATAQFPIYADTTLVTKCTELLLKCLTNTSERVRQVAVEALSIFSVAYLAPHYDRRTALIEELLSRLVSGPEPSVEGALAAIGAMRNEMMESQTPSVLIGTILRSLNAQLLRRELSYYSARATAVHSVTRLIMSLHPESLFGLRDHLHEFFQYCLLEAMHDHSQQKYRDVAFGHRAAAVQAIGALYKHFHAKSVQNSLLTEMAEESLQQLSPHCVCPQDAMRQLAIESFVTVIRSQSEGQFEQISFWLKDEEFENLYRETNCFRFFVRLFQDSRFVKHLWKGYVLSVGGLSEYTKTHSRKPLISCLRDIRKQDSAHFKFVLDSLQQLLESNVDDQIMAIPLIRTYEYLIHSGILDTFELDPRKRLLQKFWDSTRKTEDVRKITACSSALCAALRFEDLQKYLLGILVILLCYRFPVIRVATAEHLYSSLSMLGDCGIFADREESLETVLQLISETNWSANDITHLRLIRSRLCAEMNVKEPVAIKKQIPL